MPQEYTEDIYCIEKSTVLNTTDFAVHIKRTRRMEEIKNTSVMYKKKRMKSNC